MRTLLLDVQTWDLCLDAERNIAVASEPYAQAQDIASAARLFRGECWFNQSRGVPYFTDILGERPPLGLVKSELNAAAYSVPGIGEAQTFIIATDHREITGQIQAKAGPLLLVVQIPITEGGRFTINVSRIGGPDPV